MPAASNAKANEPELEVAENGGCDGVCVVLAVVGGCMLGAIVLVAIFMVVLREKSGPQLKTSGGANNAFSGDPAPTFKVQMEPSPSPAALSPLSQSQEVRIVTADGAEGSVTITTSPGGSNTTTNPDGSTTTTLPDGSTVTVRADGKAVTTTAADGTVTATTTNEDGSTTTTESGSVPAAQQHPPTSLSSAAPFGSISPAASPRIREIHERLRASSTSAGEDEGSPNGSLKSRLQAAYASTGQSSVGDADGEGLEGLPLTPHVLVGAPPV
jgi:hypothetical protein